MNSIDTGAHLHPLPRSFFHPCFFSTFPIPATGSAYIVARRIFLPLYCRQAGHSLVSRVFTQSHYHLPLSLALSDLSRVQIPNPSFHPIPFFTALWALVTFPPTFCYYMTPAMLLSFLVLYLLSSRALPYSSYPPPPRTKPDDASITLPPSPPGILFN
jgi:hypothetical protein